jgi:hypothetical protein
MCGECSQGMTNVLFMPLRVGVFVLLMSGEMSQYFFLSPDDIKDALSLVAGSDVAMFAVMMGRNQ